MGKKLSFKIEGKPVTWKRARTSKGRYYDSQTKEKQALGMIALSEAAKQGWGRSAKDLKLTAFFFGLRRSADVDNALKFLLDSFNKVVWDDDKQVVDIRGLKLPLMTGELPYTLVDIKEVEHEKRNR